MSFSSFTPTATREAKGIDFITYYQAGEAWLVKPGGATISQASDMCGHTVAVESGTVEESDAWGYMGMQPGGTKNPGDTDHCTAAGKQDITVQSYSTADAGQHGAAVGARRLRVGGPARRRLSGEDRERKAEDRRQRVQRVPLRGRPRQVRWP